MSYFSDHYPAFRYPLQEEDKPGFRLAQLGAIHAAAAHFATRNEPGIITMPTGSGKTAVLIATAFVLRAKRVLIIAPSRLVREQIAEEAASLETLKKAGAIKTQIAGPTVFPTEKRITSLAEWDKMRKFNVVVGTVPSISPEYKAIPEPPVDLFDLILVDEAHHSPARTWQAILNHFSDAKHLLFTATPFRQDQREIKGRFIFTYDLQDAYHDGIFGKISYSPVRPNEDEDHDVAIARATERQFKSDLKVGLQHRVMVRTDRQKRAEELAVVYSNNTGLRLSIVTGNTPLRHAKEIVQKLLGDKLDGIICVNMLGEGFNFPSLKIAAIHSPHRSLSVTLQFIGRFARTGDDNLGQATFLAIPSEIEIEAERLYDTRSIWQDIIQNLSATRVHQEAQTREVLESFSPSNPVAEDLEDLSLYVLKPYHHVKIYRMSEVVDLNKDIAFPNPLQVVYKTVSEEHNAAVYITREVSLPRWAGDDRLSIVQPDLFIFFQHPETNLFFICASRRSAGLYEQLVASFEAADPRPLPLVRLNRALNDLEAPEFFNVGMRNRVASNTTESYRIIAGSNADKAIQPSDGRLYHRGHAFGRASDGGNSVTIGLSSASKIWSHKSSRLPELISWCVTLATRITSDRTPAGGSGLDYLEVGKEIEELPANIVGVDWPESVYKNPPTARVDIPRKPAFRAQLLDFDFEIDTESETPEKALLVLRHSNKVKYRATFSFKTNRFIEPATPNEPAITIERERDVVSIINFLNGELPNLYTADLGLINGNSFFPAHDDKLPVFDENRLEIIDWITNNVDITKEFGTTPGGLISIHEYLDRRLATSNAAVVYYDHGTGEIADFVEFEQDGEHLVVRLFHCKSAKGQKPGHRLNDIYEIIGQVLKSVKWANKRRLLISIRRRYQENIGGHRFVRGDLDSFTKLLDNATPAQIKFEFVAVQPGLKKESLTTELANLLAGASDHLVRGGFKPLRVFCSP